MIERTNSCLIICPKGVRSKWKEAVKPFKTSFLVLSKEEFKKAAPSLPAFDGVLIDEIHHFSGIKSQMHKSLVKYLKKHKIEHVIGMSATPYRREAWNIYALAKILGFEWNYAEFRYLFYREQRFGPRVVWVPKTGMQDAIAQLVRSIGDVVSYAECGDMPPVTHKVEYVEQTTEQKRAMVDLETIEANPLTFYLREHQIMSGIFQGTSVKNAKEEYILDLCEANAKVAVFCRYTEQIDRLGDVLAENGHHVFFITGRTEDKNSVAEDIEKTDRCVVLIQADSAEGWELPSVSVAVFASMSYSYLAYTQSVGRFIRINKQNTPKLFIYLLTKDTIDEEVYKNILAKQDFDLAIYAKSK